MTFQRQSPSNENFYNAESRGELLCEDIEAC
jgi:hypothetical protein